MPLEGGLSDPKEEKLQKDGFVEADYLFYFRRVANGSRLLVKLAEGKGTRSQIQKSNAWYDRKNESRERALERGDYKAALSYTQAMAAKAEKEIQNGWLFRDLRAVDDLEHDLEELTEKYLTSVDNEIKEMDDKFTEAGESLNSLVELYLKANKLHQQYEELAPDLEDKIGRISTTLAQRKESALNNYVKMGAIFPLDVFEKLEDLNKVSYENFVVARDCLKGFSEIHYSLLRELSEPDYEKVSRLTDLVPQLASFLYRKFHQFHDEYLIPEAQKAGTTALETQKTRSAEFIESFLQLLPEDDPKPATKPKKKKKKKKRKR